MDVAEADADEHAEEAEDGGHDVVDDGGADRHPLPQQHREVTWDEEDVVVNTEHFKLNQLFTNYATHSGKLL